MCSANQEQENEMLRLEQNKSALLDDIEEMESRMAEDRDKFEA